jgi:hypothetical protein
LPEFVFNHERQAAVEIPASIRQCQRAAGAEQGDAVSGQGVGFGNFNFVRFAPIGYGE